MSFSKSWAEQSCLKTSGNYKRIVCVSVLFLDIILIPLFAGKLLPLLFLVWLGREKNVPLHIHQGPKPVVTLSPYPICLISVENSSPESLYLYWMESISTNVPLKLDIYALLILGQYIELLRSKGINVSSCWNCDKLSNWLHFSFLFCFSFLFPF